MALRSHDSSAAHGDLRLWLATRDGERLSEPTLSVGPAYGPETLLEVEFVGLTEAEQRAALAAFPGGKRFILKQH
jgi:hypothetical protein